MFSDKKIPEFENPVAKLADRPQMSAQALKAWFDSSVEEVREKFNALLDELDATTGTAVNDVSYDQESGKLLFSLVDGGKKEIDLPLELLIESGHYDAKTKNIVLVLANGDELQIPAGDLVDEYAADEKTINMTDSDGVKIFAVKDGLFLKDAPSDNALYLRKNGTWHRIPYAAHESGQYGLVKLGTKSKGIDITEDGELKLRQAETKHITGDSTELVVVKPCYFSLATAHSTHQNMSDGYDPTGFAVSQYSGMGGKQGQLPASYDAVKKYIDEKTASAGGAALPCGGAFVDVSAADGRLVTIMPTVNGYYKYLLMSGFCTYPALDIQPIKSDGSTYQHIYGYRVQAPSGTRLEHDTSKKTIRFTGVQETSYIIEIYVAETADTWCDLYFNIAEV